MFTVGLEDTVVVADEPISDLLATPNAGLPAAGYGPEQTGPNDPITGLSERSTSQSPPAPPESCLVVDTKGDRYLLEGILGSGRVGTVYRAISTRVPRLFAAKVTWSCDNPGFRTRFENEVRALSRLSSPHVVKIVDVIEYHQGAGLVMELIEGRTLSAVLKEHGRLDEARVRTIALQIAAALDSVHQAGMTHCDIKPGNVMVTPLPHGGDFIHLIDFDVVQFRDQVADYSFAGTPRYSSPEQIRGEQLVATSDIYSFGVVLYTMLTGRSPFQSKTPRELFRQHLKAPVPTLAAACPDRRFSDELEGLVSRMLSKDKQARPQTMADVAHEIRALGGTPHSSSGEHSIDRRPGDRIVSMRTEDVHFARRSCTPEPAFDVPRVRG